MKPLAARLAAGAGAALAAPALLLAAVAAAPAPLPEGRGPGLPLEGPLEEGLPDYCGAVVGACGDEAPCDSEEADCGLHLLQRRARKATGPAPEPRRREVRGSLAALQLPPTPGFEHLVLKSDSITATLFLPPTSSAPLSRAYYRSTRFDWGTMVGDVHFRRHLLMRSDVWRTPHDPDSPEAGLGLASEFGCGADGATCGPGWGTWKSGSVNGVLGYEEARPGEPFLKIGVGKLVKGSCSDCKDGDDTYRFNSKYAFVERPEWRVRRHGEGVVVLEHEAQLDSGWGYKLQHRFEPYGRSLTLETLIQNTGNRSFRTPWYSHNFLNVDDNTTGWPWAVKFPFNVRPHKEPPWSAKVSDFFQTVSANVLRAKRSIKEGAKLKVRFPNRGSHKRRARGRFEALFGHLHLTSELLDAPRPLYDYILYAEQRTLSPEPQLMIDLGPNEYKLWRQVLTFR